MEIRVKHVTNDTAYRSAILDIITDKKNYRS